MDAEPQDGTPGRLAQVGGALLGVVVGALAGTIAGTAGILLGGLAGAVGGWWSGRAIVESARD